jgi:hypothetical protein
VEWKSGAEEGKSGETKEDLNEKTERRCLGLKDGTIQSGRL